MSLYNKSYFFYYLKKLKLKLCNNKTSLRAHFYYPRFNKDLILSLVSDVQKQKTKNTCEI